MPTLHSKLGASSSKRWLACPASIRLAEGRPSSPTNKYAAEGTVAHKVCETALQDKKPAKAYIGLYGDGDLDCDLYSKSNGAKFEFEVTAEMARACQVYLDAINEKVDELRFQFGVEPLILIEKSFSLGFIQEGMFGTNDACIWVPGKYLGIYDYKHGRGLAVEVEDNSQMNYYGLGALRELCWQETNSFYEYLPEEVELVIVQPRARHANGPVRRWPTTAEYLTVDFAETLRHGAAETLKPDSLAFAGSHCKWCTAEPICPAIQKKTEDELRISFDDLDPADFEKPREAKKAGKAHGAQQALDRTPEELGKIVAAIPFIEGWAATMKAHAQTLLENGKEVQGQKLVEGRTRRKWINPETVSDTLSLLLDEDDYLKPPELKSFTEIEVLPGMAKVVFELTEKPEPGLTMAPITDKRPAKSKSAKSAGFETDDLI